MSTTLTCGTPWPHTNSATDGDQSTPLAVRDARTPRSRGKVIPARRAASTDLPAAPRPMTTTHLALSDGASSGKDHSQSNSSPSALFCAVRADSARCELPVCRRIPAGGGPAFTAGRSVSRGRGWLAAATGGMGCHLAASGKPLCPRCPPRQSGQATEACDVSPPRPAGWPWSASRGIPRPSGMMPGSSR